MKTTTTNVRIGFIGENLEEAKFDLREFLSSFDGDLSGANGKEYVLDSALELGYESTLDFLIEESQAKDVKSLIIDVMDEVLRTYDSYDFRDYNFARMPQGGYTVAFTSSDD